MLPFHGAEIAGMFEVKPFDDDHRDKIHQAKRDDGHDDPGGDNFKEDLVGVQLADIMSRGNQRNDSRLGRRLRYSDQIGEKQRKGYGKEDDGG